MGTLLIMKSAIQNAMPKRYSELSRVLRTKGSKAARRFLAKSIRLKGSEWEVWIDHCYNYDGPVCRLFRSYMA